MIEARERKRCLAGATFRDDIAPAEHRFLVVYFLYILHKIVQGVYMLYLFMGLFVEELQKMDWWYMIPPPSVTSADTVLYLDGIAIATREHCLQGFPVRLCDVVDGTGTFLFQVMYIETGTGTIMLTYPFGWGPTKGR